MAVQTPNNETTEMNLWNFTIRWDESRQYVTISEKRGADPPVGIRLPEDVFRAFHRWFEERRRRESGEELEK